MTFAIDRRRNKSQFVAKVQLHQNRVQCSFVLRGRYSKVLATRVFSHVVHDFGLLTDNEVQVWRSIISYAEHNSRRFQEIIDELVQLSMRLPGVITMQKHNYR